jgi:hypothetical protein
MEPLIDITTVYLLISKGKYNYALACASFLPEEERVQIREQILGATLLDKLLLDEAKDLAEELPEPQKTFWLKKVCQIQMENFLFDDARYTVGKIEEKEGILHTLAIMKMAREITEKTGHEDTARELKGEDLLKKYLSLGMFKRARKVAKEMEEDKRTAFLNFLPKEIEDKKEKATQT